MEQLVQAVRFALRRLRKSPGFPTVAVLTLALGIGGNTAIFTLIHAVMLKSLPVADPQKLYRLGDRDACCVISGYQTRFAIFSSSLYQYLRDHTSEFTEMAAAQADRVPVSVHRSGASSLPDSLVGEFVSGNYFSLFGIQGFAVRLFTATDGSPGTPPLVVITYHVWGQR